MKKIKTKLLTLYLKSFVILWSFLSWKISFAAESSEYKVMEGLPGFFKAGEVIQFPKYIMSLYKFGLWTIGICAVIMIMIGGFTYITSAGNSSRTTEAKKIITDAIAGVFLALISYLLLYTINPDLVKFVDIQNWGK
jgi:hypothetical protein